MSHTITFDTLEFAKKLKTSGFEEKQAEALSEAIKEVQEVHLEELATKADISGVKRDIKEAELRLETKLADTKAEIIKWCVGSVIGSVTLFATIIKLLG